MAIRQEIQSCILKGEHKPGEWLSVEALCQRFKVSRQPVMEAMRGLSSDWLVEIVPQVGCRVASYDSQSIIDYVATFGELEAHIAEMAAQRRTEEQLSRLNDLTEEIMLLDDTGPENLHLNRNYHSLVLEMAHSTVLARLCDRLWLLGAFAVNILADTDTSTTWISRSRDTILRLTRAIADADGELARTCMSVWLTESVTEIIENRK